VKKSKANIEEQNKEPQKDEVTTSIFEISCSIFCGSKRWPFDKLGAKGTRLRRGYGVARRAGSTG
jgi:hypothetical protein